MLNIVNLSLLVNNNGHQLLEYSIILLKYIIVNSR